MNSVVFITGFVGALVGTVSGYLLKHFQDNRHFNELFADLLDMSIALDRKDKHIAYLREQINRYNELRAMNEIRCNKNVQVLRDMGCNAEFLKVNDLPDHFKDDIDFGGKF